MSTWPAIEIAMITGGVGLLGVVYLALSGRYRGWAKDSRGPIVMLAVLPGLGLILILFGMSAILGVDQDSVMSAVTVIAVIEIIAFVITVLEPSWWGPKWYRQYMGIGTRKEPGKIGRHPVVEPIYRDATGARVRKLRNPIDRALYEEQPIDQWQATLVQDLDRQTGYRGRLALYPEGLTFLEHRKGGTRKGDAERVGFEMLAIDIAGIHIVPETTLRDRDEPGAEAKRLRPAVPWVIVRMRDQDAARIFSVSHPKAAARRISEHLGFDLADGR
jgi:hypothetical protein